MDHQLAAVLRDANAENSPLLALPGELRNRIYRDVLVSAQVQIDLPTSHSAFGLLQASSQFRAEAAPLLYEESASIISDAKGQRRHLGRFLRWIGKDNAARLRRLIFKFGEPSEWGGKISYFIRDCPVKHSYKELEAALAGDRNRVQAAEEGIVKSYYAAFERIASDLIHAGVHINNIAIQEEFNEVEAKDYPVLAGVQLVQMLNRYFTDIIHSEWKAINVGRS